MSLPHLTHITTRDPGTWLPIPLDGPEIDRLAALPFEIVAGIRSLLIDPAPTHFSSGAWSDMAFDAAQLAADGWARLALDLGWSPLDLFGCSSLRPTDDRRPAIAAAIAGRRVRAITASGLQVARGLSSAMLLRPDSTSPRCFLWELSR